jgi:hypothetical protein
MATIGPPGGASRSGQGPAGNGGLIFEFKGLTAGENSIASTLQNISIGSPPESFGRNDEGDS